MIPLKDNIPTRRFPVLTVALIAVNVAVFLVDTLFQQRYIVGYRMTPDGGTVPAVEQVGMLAAHYSLIPANLTSDFANAWPTIFISMFLHSNWLHIGGNMLYLWIFGNNVEDALGRFRFLIFYLACGVVAAVAQVATDPHSTIPIVGASGAIAGVMGAYIVLFPEAQVLSIVPIFIIGMFMEVPAIIVIGFWALLNFVNAQWLGGGGMRGGGVAYQAHVAGFLAGILFILLLGGRRLRARPEPGYYPYPR
jgi:membrane associated rhomboid family serine protease